MSMHTEITEQPDVFEEALSVNREPMRATAARLAETNFDYIVIAARGTSDNAARYAKYLWGSHNRIPVALAAPSLFTSYHTPPRLDGALVVGISQSGASPDLVAVLTEARAQGRPTMAITNESESPIAQQADIVIDIRAGSELAVAATKTYTAQLLAVAMLSASLSPGDAESELGALPGLVEEVLAAEEEISRTAAHFTDMTACAVLGRGYNHATAFEWALKTQEVSYVLAHPYSSADFRHGPIAVVEPDFPVLAVAPNGQLFDDMVGLLSEITAGKDARTVVVTDRRDAVDAARHVMRIPDMVEWLTPIPAIVVGQLFTYHLGVAKGLDIERPRGLSKVTKTT